MTNYSIDTGHGTQLTAGLQGYDHARDVAQWLADERGEPVFLYATGRVDGIDEGTGEAEVATEEVKPDEEQVAEIARYAREKAHIASLTVGSKIRVTKGRQIGMTGTVRDADGGARIGFVDADGVGWEIDALAVELIEAP